jgi:hypothetical protein
LIGVVDAYQPYREPAISPQTQETRIILEENSGLAAILPIETLPLVTRSSLTTFNAEVTLRGTSGQNQTLDIRRDRPARLIQVKEDRALLPGPIFDPAIAAS